MTKTLDDARRALRALYAQVPEDVARDVESLVEGALRELIADAERYRWLREHTVVTGLSRWMGSKQFLDDAIAAEQAGEWYEYDDVPTRHPKA